MLSAAAAATSRCQRIDARCLLRSSYRQRAVQCQTEWPACGAQPQLVLVARAVREATRFRPRTWSGATRSAPPAPTRGGGADAVPQAGRTVCRGAGTALETTAPASATPGIAAWPAAAASRAPAGLQQGLGDEGELALAREQATYSLLRVSGLIVRKLPACHARTFPGFRTTHTSPYPSIGRSHLSVRVFRTRSIERSSRTGVQKTAETACAQTR